LASGLAPPWEGLEVAKKLWARLRPKVEEKPAAAEAAQVLEEDASLAAELAKLVEAAGPRQTWSAELHGSGAIAQGQGNVVAGAGGIAAGRDVKRQG
jgi:hypothetical protein